MKTSEFHKIQINGGDCRVSRRPRDIFCTVLGSCVAICIFDPVARIGGMNHYLLPHNRGGDSMRYGEDASRRLLALLLRAGAVRHRLAAKLYGGARILSGDADIGRMNIDFGCDFLRDNDIPIIEWDLGGEAARWVDFHPVTGRAAVRIVEHGATARVAAR
jgi:chemotaxis protein CheD